MQQQNKPNCMFFQKGTCKKGTDCEFNHVLDEKQPCIFFQRGSCKKGNECEFPHILVNQEATAPAPVPPLFQALFQAHDQDQTPVQVQDVANQGQNPKKNQQKECAFFQKGTCRNGANCEFLHVVRNESEPLKQKQCAFFLKGTCRNGPNCEFAHTMVQAQNQAQDQVQVQEKQQMQNQRKCAFFQKGMCNKGENCTFLHVLEPLPVNQPVVDQPMTKNNSR